MKKIIFTVLVNLAIASFIFATGGSDTVSVQASKADGKLVLYSPANDEEYYMIVDAFKAKYPKIEIETVQGGSGELKTRLASEQANPKADVMFGGLAYSDAVAYKDLWAEYVSENDVLLPAAFRNTTGLVTLKSVNLQTIIVNRTLEQKAGITITGLRDLLNPALKGKIAMPDPGSSATAYRWLTCMLFVMGNGNPGSPEAWNYVENLIKNLDGKLASSMSVAHKSVYAGEYIVGLTSESNASAYLADGFGNVVRVVYPIEGTTAPSYGVAMINKCPHPDNAKLFIDFIISDEGQQIYAKSSFRPANTAHKNTSPYLPNIAAIKLVKEDDAYITKNRKAILERFNALWAKYN